MSRKSTQYGSDIAVVIPFFQRVPGILARTVRSVLAQQGVDGFRIVVVDDSSPVRGRDELKEFMEDAGDRIVLVEQANSGAAGARNKGLDSVPEGTKYVAFVDSDDEWSPQHLSNALFALTRDFDFYFADFFQLAQTVTAFARAKRIDVGDHPFLDGSQEVHEYRRSMVDQIITGNVLGTSVTVYAYHKMRDLRFRTGFRHTGEEYLFWMDLALRSKKIAFGDQPECRYGAGVNIYSESAWGQEKYLTVITDDIKYRRQIIKEYDISATQRAFIKSRIKQLRTSFTMGLLNHVRVNHKIPGNSVLPGYIKVDPLYPFMIWPAVLDILTRKIKS